MENITETIPENSNNENYPALKARVQSTFIDSILVFVSLIIVGAVLDGNPQATVKLRVVLITLVLLYEPVCMALGATLGNYMMNIRVRRANNNMKKIPLLKAILRYIVKIALGWLSFLTMQSANKRRAIHDLASDSIMIHAS